MKTINWKGNISALIIILFVAASYFFVHKDEFMPQDASYITAKADMSQDDITAVDTISDDSPIVDDSNMQDKPEIKVGDPYQDVLQVMGEPDDKVVSKTKYGTTELWSYYNEGKSLFFDSGVLEDITEVN